MYSRDSGEICALCGEQIAWDEVKWLNIPNLSPYHKEVIINRGRVSVHENCEALIPIFIGTVYNKQFRKFLKDLQTKQATEKIIEKKSTTTYYEVEHNRT